MVLLLGPCSLLVVRPWNSLRWSLRPLLPAGWQTVEALKHLDARAQHPQYVVTKYFLTAIYVQMAPSNAFIELYEREAEPVLLFFVRRTLDVEISLDLTAETFAQAWGGWSRVRLDSAEEVRGWLFTIARRQLGRYLRRGRVEQNALNRYGFTVPEFAADEIAEIERAAGLDALRRALATELEKLTEEQRSVLQLRIVEELPYREVARQLNIAEPTARARVSRSLRVLAIALEPIAADQRSSQ